MTATVFGTTIGSALTTSVTGSVLGYSVVGAQLSNGSISLAYTAIPILPAPAVPQIAVGQQVTVRSTFTHTGFANATTVTPTVGGTPAETEYRRLGPGHRPPCGQLGWPHLQRRDRAAGRR